MRLHRWADRSPVGRHDRRDGRFQSLMTHVTQSSLTVNLTPDKAPGLTIPEPILLRADEVIR